MPVQLNNKAVTNAKGMIRVGNINSTATWSFSASDGNKLLGGNDDWAEFSKWHLAEDTSATKKTKERFKYPFGKGGKIYLSALRAIRSRSAQAGSASIFKAAGELLDSAKAKVEKTSYHDMEVNTITDLIEWTKHYPFILNNSRKGETKMAEDKNEMEIRGIGEIRSTDEQGIIEAYLTKWNTVDEYRSTFKEGSFKKTFQERGNKIKLIWNHEDLIGKVIEAREDQHGPFVRGQINLETTAGKEAYAHCKAGDVDAFSFGFNVIQDKWVDGIRHIGEVRCMECGPVIFPANERAEIIQVREDPNGKVEEKRAVDPDESPTEVEVETIIPEEENALDFDETVLNNEINGRGYKLFSALDQTLMDIWWSPLAEGVSPVGLVDDAIQKFHGAYVEWANDYINMNNDTRSIPNAGEITAALFEHSQGDLDEIAKTTSLTISELRGLQENKLLPMESRAKLVELPEAIQRAHQKERSEIVSKFCDELRRGGFSDAERSRFKGLLGIENKDEESDQEERSEDISAAIDGMTKLRESLKEKSNV